MGYDVKKVVGNVDTALLCCKCKQVLDNPVKTSCGHLCCSVCLKTAQDDSAGRKGAGKLLCCKCGMKLSKEEGATVDKELCEKLEKIAIECILGCKAVMSLKDMQKHIKAQCRLRLMTCVNRGCSHQCQVSELEKHLEECDYRLVECKVCKACVSHYDMPAHQAVKQCYMKELNSKRVASARKLSGELKGHRIELQHQKHKTDQVERKMVKDHYEKQRVDYFIQRRRAQSASAVLTQSIETRVGSALVVPRYSRTLSLTTPMMSCWTCESKFLSGRRPSAQRHSHSKCDHCEHWKRWNGPRGWPSIMNNS